MATIGDGLVRLYNYKQYNIRTFTVVKEYQTLYPRVPGYSQTHQYYYPSKNYRILAIIAPPHHGINHHSRTIQTIQTNIDKDILISNTFNRVAVLIMIVYLKS